MELRGDKRDAGEVRVVMVEDDDDEFEDIIKRKKRGTTGVREKKDKKLKEKEKWKIK